MPERTASAHWEGTVREGKGTVGVESGLFDGAPTRSAPASKPRGTNPRSCWAAHAGCFTMYLSLLLTSRHPHPTRNDGQGDDRDRDEGPRITGRARDRRRDPGIDAATFDPWRPKRPGLPRLGRARSTPITHTARLAAG